MAFTKPSSLSPQPIIAISGTVGELQSGLLEYVNPEKPNTDDASVYYQRFYVSIFNLDKDKIEAKFSSPLKIQNGDTVTVSGYYKNNRFEVLAYRNQTQQLMGAENWKVMALGAIFFIAIVIGLLSSKLTSEGTLIPRLFLLGFVVLAIYMGYRALLIRKAIGLVQTS